jgi:hypothetical protein
MRITAVFSGWGIVIDQRVDLLSRPWLEYVYSWLKVMLVAFELCKRTRVRGRARCELNLFGANIRQIETSIVGGWLYARCLP